MQKTLRTLIGIISLPLLLTACGGSDDGIRIYGGIKHDGYLPLDFGGFNSSGVVLGNKAYIAGGYTAIDNNGEPTNMSDKIRTIDFPNGLSSKEISMGRPRANMVAVGVSGQAYFAGGEMLDGSNVTYSSEIYLLSGNGEWNNSSLRLSEPRTQFAGTYTGRKLIFGGGRTGDKYLSSIDIFDLMSKENQKTNLSTPRAELSCAIANNLVFFAGGINGDGTCRDIEVYDVNKGYFITNNEQLKEARAGMASEATQGYVLFAGGRTNTGYSSAVDIYNVNTQKWSEGFLSESRIGIATASASNFILFAGGQTGNDAYSTTVDVFDTRQGKFINSLQLSEARAYATAVAINNRIYIIGGMGKDGPSKYVDIFELN